ARRSGPTAAARRSESARCAAPGRRKTPGHAARRAAACIWPGALGRALGVVRRTREIRSWLRYCIVGVEAPDRPGQHRPAPGSGPPRPEGLNEPPGIEHARSHRGTFRRRSPDGDNGVRAFLPQVLMERTARLGPTAVREADPLLVVRREVRQAGLG